MLAVGPPSAPALATASVPAVIPIEPPGVVSFTATRVEPVVAIAIGGMSRLASAPWNVTV